MGFSPGGWGGGGEGVGRRIHCILINEGCLVRKGHESCRHGTCSREHHEDSEWIFQGFQKLLLLTKISGYSIYGSIQNLCLWMHFICVMWTDACYNHFD